MPLLRDKVCPHCNSKRLFATGPFLSTITTDDELNIRFECMDCCAMWIEYYSGTPTRVEIRKPPTPGRT